jgi:hypothetical protein
MSWISQAASSYRTPISSETAETGVSQNAHAEVREAVVASELLVRIGFGGVAFGVVDLGCVDLGGIDLDGVFACLASGDVDLGDVALRKCWLSGLLVVPLHAVVEILVPFAAVCCRSWRGALLAHDDVSACGI